MVKHSIVPGLRSIEYEAAAGSIHSSIVPTSNSRRGAVIVIVMVICSMLRFPIVVLEKDLDRRRDRMSVVCRRWYPSHHYLRVLNLYPL
jgi:hypothetical protein